MNEPYDIFFTGSTNPRECIMIGGIRGTEQAIYLEFRTPNIPTTETQTTILCNGHREVARFDWTINVHLGMVTIEETRIHMSELVQPSTVSNNCRIFRTADGQTFHWRRVSELNGYDLYRLGPNQQEVSVAAQFRMTELTNSPIGPCHAHMQSWLANKSHSLYASLALCLNRWIDWQGL